MSGLTTEPGLSQPVSAGVVAALVGFASSFTIVLAGFHAVGADDRQAASGLLTLSVAMGVLSIVFAVRYRAPVGIAWSTPGAALLVSSHHVAGGYPAALGAFAVTGALIMLAGLWGSLARWIAAIPVPLASAMLAGVLLELCVAPVKAVVALPGQAIPVVVVWLVLTRVARRWAVPGALVVAAIVIVATETLHGGSGLLPHPVFTQPRLTTGAVLSLAVPLFVVTMASQNVPGIGVLASFGYRPPLRPLLLATGAATVAGAPLGGQAVNLAAVTAAMMAGPDAHPHPARRWVAAAASGVVYILLGLCAGLATTLIAAAPPLLIEAVAGLALLGPLGAALASATRAEGDVRDAAIVTFVVAGSGVTALGIGGAFWGLLAGLALLAVRRL